MATSDKSGKPGKQGTSRRRTTRTTSRKKATRPPTIDLEATEVADAAGSEKTPPERAESKPATGKPGDEKAAGEKSASGKPDDAPAEAAGEKVADAAPAEDIKGKSTAKPDSTGDEAGTKTKDAPATGPAGRSSVRDSVASLKPDPAEPQPATESQPELAGFSLIAVGGAAAAGALLSLVVLVGLDRAGVLPWRADTSGIDPVQVTAKLDALESQITGLANKAPARDPALDTRVATLEKDLNTAGTAVAALPGLIDTLASRLDSLESTVNETQAKTQSALAGLKTIESAVDTIGSGESSAAPSSEALELKLSALASRVERFEEQAQAANNGELPALLEDLERNIVEIKTALSASDGRIDEISGQVEAIPEGVTPDAFAKALGLVRSAIENRLDVIEKRLGGPGETRGVASAIALSSLRRTIDRGAPFAAELAAFSALVPDEPAADVVRPFADGGLMTRPELTARFAVVVEESRRVAKAEDPSQDITGSILSRLKTVVTVRRTGEDDGKDAGAVMARMAKLLNSGDFAGAVAQGNAAGDVLPAGPKEWLATAQARLAADKALADADARMLAALAKSGD